MRSPVPGRCQSGLGVVLDSQHPIMVATNSSTDPPRKATWPQCPKVFNAVFGLAPLSVRAASGAVAGGSAPPNDWFAALAETWALSSGSEARGAVEVVVGSDEVGTNVVTGLRRCGHFRTPGVAAWPLE